MPLRAGRARALVMADTPQFVWRVGCGPGCGGGADPHRRTATGLIYRRSLRLAVILCRNLDPYNNAGFSRSRGPISAPNSVDRYSSLDILT